MLLKNLKNYSALVVWQLWQLGYRYIARDKNGQIIFYKNEPIREKNIWSIYDGDSFGFYLNSKWSSSSAFRDILWENSPYYIHKDYIVLIWYLIVRGNIKLPHLLLTGEGQYTKISSFSELKVKHRVHSFEVGHYCNLCNHFNTQRNHLHYCKKCNAPYIDIWES